MQAVMKVAPGAGNVALREIPEPEAGPGQVKIEVHSAGICGTDIHILKDEFKSWPPVVLGHAVSGRVAGVGAGVTRIQTGDRVTTETYFSTCGTCRFCRKGETNLCLNRRSIGSAVNGGFTQYLVVPEQNVHRLPENISFEAGALTEPLACVVHAVLLNAPTVAAGDLAVIAGPGAIGLLTLQVVKAAGAKAVVLGTGADKQRLEMAMALGADRAVNIQETDPVQLIQELSEQGLGADAVYECSGAGPAARQLLELVRRRGRYIQIGLFGQPVSWDLDQLCYKELYATGSNASTPESWLRALQLLASGTVDTEALISNTFPLTDWERAFQTFDEKSGIKTLLQPVG